jgi:hypothetical protein
VGYLFDFKSGRDRDRTDDLYRVKVARVVYIIDSSPFSLHDPGGFLMMFGANCSQVVPKFLKQETVAEGGS